MNIGFGCTNMIDSIWCLNLIVRKYKLPIRLIIISEKELKVDGVAIHGFGGIIYLFKRLGPKYLFYMISRAFTLPFIANLLNIFRKKEKKLYSIRKLARMNNIKIIHSKNMNSSDALKQIDNENLDIFVSCCLDQILKKEFIKLPRKAVINIHPSLLPDFRGIDPIIQLMISKETKYGSTLHNLTTDIDCGEIYLQSTIERKLTDSHLALIFKFVHTAMEQLNTFYDQVKNGVDIKPIPQNTKVTYPYESWPSKNTLNCIKQKGMVYSSRKDRKKTLTYSL